MDTTDMVRHGIYASLLVRSGPLAPKRFDAAGLAAGLTSQANQPTRPKAERAAPTRRPGGLAAYAGSPNSRQACDC